jgi:hypothetical protein
MSSLRTRAHLAWLGILLVLMPLIAPTISHALVRAQGGDARHVAWIASLDTTGWCSPQGLSAPSETPSDDAPPSHHAAACDYCGWPLGLAAVPTLSTELPPPQGLAVGLPTWPEADAPTALPPSAHRARAPPVLADDRA